MTTPAAVRGNAVWGLAALVAIASLTSVSYRTVLTAKFGTQELLTAPLLVSLALAVVVCTYGLRLTRSVGALVRTVFALLSVSIIGLLVLLGPGSPFPFLGVVYQPWGGYVLTLLLAGVGAVALRKVNSEPTALPLLQAIAVAAAGISLFTWLVALGGFAYFYANK